MIVVLMGVSGVGKTTVGHQLAQALGWCFFDADDFHTSASREKMRQGVALTDEDRRPWLDAIAQHMQAQCGAGQSAVFTCSALRASHRQLLRSACPPGQVKLVSLELDKDTLRDRLQQRTGHFFNPALLDSQLATLEEPHDANLRLSANLPVPELVAQIRHALATDGFSI